MSQISAMISASASLVDTSAMDTSPMKLFIVLAVVAMALGAAVSGYASRKTKGNLSVYSFLGGFLIGTILAITGVSLGAKAYEASEKDSNTKIAHFIQEKYGVTVLNDQNIGTDIRDHTMLTLNPIPAKDPNGERIQITVELAENDTDVLAFSSGAEMKKVSE
jgi:hypothetical protein